MSGSCNALACIVGMLLGLREGDGPGPFSGEDVGREVGDFMGFVAVVDSDGALDGLLVIWSDGAFVIFDNRHNSTIRCFRKQ